MRIGIIGAGRMGAALGRRWAGLGHELLISGRSFDRAKVLADTIGARAKAGSMAEAAAFGDVVLVAVLYPGLLETLLKAGASDGAFIGKTVIDCNNAVEIDGFSVTTGGGKSMAEHIAATARGASVVKAFHLCHSAVWEMDPPVFDGRPLSVPICGDEPDSKIRVASLIKEMGCLPIDLGPLAQARNLEPMAAVIIKLLHTGAKPTANFNLVSA